MYVQALVHGDLNCNNVLIQQTNNEDKEGFKVVDFEKCFYGPCGLDLGLFLSNYLWYYAVHANPSVRRSLVSGVSAVIEAYKSAFIVQLLGVLGKANQQSDVRPEALFEEVHSVIAAPPSTVSNPFYSIQFYDYIYNIIIICFA